MRTRMFLLVVVAVCQTSLAQFDEVMVEAWQRSCRFHAPDGNPVRVGIEATDAWGSLSLAPSPSPATLNTSPGTTVNVEWLGPLAYHGPGPGYFDDFSVQSSVPLIRAGHFGIRSRCYHSFTVAEETAVDLFFDLGGQPNPGSGDDRIEMEVNPDLPVRSVRLQLFESQAGINPTGELVNSLFYLNPAEVEPFMNIKNLGNEPIHYVVSTGAFDAMVDIGDHDDYAAMLGMVSDGVVRTLPAAGDFDENGVYDLNDMDALSLHLFEIANGAEPDLRYDINADQVVDPMDAERWLANAGAVNNPSGGPFLPADGNLDGYVDGADFILWNSHKFTPTPGWSRGDWNYDGVVDGSDFILWNSHKFSSSDVSAVPEPSTAGLLLLGLAGIGIRRTRR